MLKDDFDVTGSLTIHIFAEDGSLKHEQEEHNLVVNTGLAFIASRMASGATAVMSHMGIGTSTAAPAGGQTTLGTEIARSGLDSTTVVTTTVAGDSVQYIATFNPGTGTGAITEAGIFNDSSAGSMLCRTTFNVVNKDANDKMVITWKVVAA